MIQKVLAWSSLATALLFAGIACTSVFANESLGDMAPTLVLYAAIPLLCLSILLAVAMLIVAACGP